MLNSESNFNLSDQIRFGSQLRGYIRKAAFSILRLTLKSDHFVCKRFHVLLCKIALQLCLCDLTSALHLLLQKPHLGQLVAAFNLPHITFQSINQLCVLSD